MIPEDMTDFIARIKPKKSSVAGEVPLASDLEVAEIAVNTADAKLFTKHSDGSVVELTSASGGGSSVSNLADLDDVENALPSNDGELLFSDDGVYKHAPISELLSGRDAAMGSVTSAITNDTNMAGINGFYADITALQNDGFTALSANNIDDATIEVPSSAWQDYAQVDWVGQTFSDLYFIRINSNGSVYLHTTGLAIASRNPADYAFIHSSVSLVVSWAVQDTETRLGGYKEITQDGTDWFVVRVDMKVPYNDEDAGYPLETWFGKDGRIRQYFGDKVGSASSLQTSPTQQGIATFGTNLTNVTGLNPLGGQRIEYTAPAALSAIPGAKLEDLSDVGTPSDGEVLTYDAGTSSWVSSALPAASLVDSVNGETGDVSLGIQDMDDFEFNPSSGAGWLITAEASQSAGMSPGNGYVSGAGAVAVSPIDSQGENRAVDLSNWVATLTLPASVEFLFNGVSYQLSITSTVDETGGVGSYKPRYTFGFGSNPFGVERFIGQELTITEFNAYLNPDAPLVEGDILKWNDAAQKFKPAQHVDSVNGETGVVSLGIQEMDDFELTQAANSVIFPNRTQNMSLTVAEGDWTSAFYFGAGGGFYLAWLSAANGGGDSATEAERIGVGDTVTFLWPDMSTSTETVASTFTSGILKAMVISDPHGSIYSGHANGTPLRITSAAITVGVDTPLVEGNILKWNDAAQKFKPAQSPVDSVNGETGVVSLGIQEMDDFDYKRELPTFYTRTIIDNFVSTPGEYFVNSSTKVFFIAKLNADGVDETANWDSYFVVGGRIYWRSTSNSDPWQSSEIVSVSSDSNRYLITVADTPSNFQPNLEFTWSNPEETAPVPLTEGDILQWNDVDQKFKPAQLPAAPVDANGHTLPQLFGIGAHVSFDASSGGSFDFATDAIASGNISNVTRTATGKFTIEFDNDFASNAYTAVCTAGDEDHSGTGASPRCVNVVSRSAGSMDIVVERSDDAAQDDEGYIAVMVIGLLA